MDCETPTTYIQTGNRSELGLFFDDLFDNAIHRIIVLEESLSVHMNSSYALKGACYHDYPNASPFLGVSDEELTLLGCT
ncbi:MAG: hypothetical protein ACI8ZB_002337 [Desulforhopalus sp.]|jgi:hypothetical protein